MEKTFLVSEIYGPVIQGEGPVVGVPTVFVRFGGCDYRCVWCDSLYAVLPEHKSTWTKMTATEIIDRVWELAGQRPILVTLSGGNPALQDCESLLTEGWLKSLTFAIETQGTKAPRWLERLEWVVLSPKGPSSGMTTEWSELDDCVSRADRAEAWAMKIVVFDDQDYEFARKAWERYRPTNFYLQSGTLKPYRDTSSFETMAMFRNDILTSLNKLSERVIEDKWYEARVLPQIHALIYGSKRGV